MENIPLGIQHQNPFDSSCPSAPHSWTRLSSPYVIIKVSVSTSPGNFENVAWER